MTQDSSISSRIKDELSRWMVPPANSWRRKSKSAFISSELYWPINTLLACISVVVLTALLIPWFGDYVIVFSALQILFLIFSLIAIFQIITRTKRNLLDPLTHLRYWATRIRGGQLLARIPVPVEDNEFRQLVNDINSVSDSLRGLTHDMNEQVRIQTRKTEQKSNSLKILYDVATSINNSQNLDELLTQCMKTLKSLVHARAASIRLLTDNNELKLMSSIGLDKEVIKKERLIAISRCECGNAVADGSMKCQDIQKCGNVIEQPLFNNSDMKMIAVPLKYRGKTLGIYNLFVDNTELAEQDELYGLLTSIGQHLGVAVAKSKLENETRRLALMEERTLLSHELHDSLAQTLASLRFQVSILEEILEQTPNVQAKAELSRLNSGLEKANQDLREMLDHFRTPMDERGLIPALKDLCQQYRAETGIAIFFQDETANQNLPPDNEVQVLHIVQEALSNVRKHSKAQNVRILLKVEDG
ncbi:MAG: histidine kinase, partial [Gammaproteobacteria bacterium]|nr:histidine kinase [Gammaproteobacteria bacterium]